jgi:hypothetical protein
LRFKTFVETRRLTFTRRCTFVETRDTTCAGGAGPDCTILEGLSKVSRQFGCGDSRT